MSHVCKALADCKTAIQDIRDDVKYPTICSFKGKVPVVCCAPDIVSREERLAKAADDAPDILPGITREYTCTHIVKADFQFMRLEKSRIIQFFEKIVAVQRYYY